MIVVLGIEYIRNTVTAKFSAEIHGNINVPKVYFVLL